MTTATAKASLRRDLAVLRSQLAPPPVPDALALARLAGMAPDPWQADVLQATEPRLLLNCCRQSGKSTTVAVLAVATALARPGALVLLVSPTLRQSGELFRKAAGVYRASGRVVPSESETALTLTLTNGSRLVSLPGKEGTVRGYSGATLIAIDEAARVPDDLYLSLRPMLAVSGGRLIAMSTPFGTRGWWHAAFTGAEPWERITITAEQCPRIPAAFLEEERRTMGPYWFNQEYLCRFEDAETAAFSRVDIDAAFSEETESWAL